MGQKTATAKQRRAPPEPLRPDQMAPKDTDPKINSTVTDTSNQVLVSRWYVAHFEALSRQINSAFGAGPPDPEDVAQRTFEKLLGRDNLSAIENVKAYLWHIARNTFLTEVRALTRRRKLDFAIEEIFLLKKRTV
ncbi:MAG: sigma factor [Pseudomonadota bacterium]